MKKISRMFLRAGVASALCVLGVCGATPSNVRAKVVYVDDGDTVVLLTASHQKINTRLSSIDAPESSHVNKEAGRLGQPYSEKAKNYLSAMVKGETVEAQCFEEDVHHRQVCELFLGGKSVNREMVRAGFAWANMAAHGRYLRDKTLTAVEAEARTAKRGLWAGTSPVEPWVWRKACWTQSVCAGAE
jgi:micrococcal nuclease